MCEENRQKSLVIEYIIVLIKVILSCCQLTIIIQLFRTRIWQLCK